MELGGVLDEFYENVVLPKGVCSFFITLVPKRDNPLRLSDYRLISLIGYLHNQTAKLLAARLKYVLSPLISPC